ncbi:MAG: DJ-1 family protein [Spirochaetes bacterium]|nr:MAG: DJ-1 family protein [Spirochaetota bacterium]
MKKVAVLLADGFEEVEALTPVDFLRRAGIEVITAGIGGREIKGGHDIKVIADVEIDRLKTDELDGVIIPGGNPGAKNVGASKEALKLVRDIEKEGKLIAAICAAPALVLAPAGVLSGKKATCYPGYEGEFKDTSFSDDRVVVDGNLITSRGPGTAAEFSIEIIRYLVGDEKADEVHKRTLQK